MMMTIRLAMLLLLAPGFFLLSVARVEAQEDKWSFVVTPQVWFSNIPFSGFASAICGISNNATCGSTNPTSPLFPQWGGQFAGQYGHWTIGVAAQYASYETSTALFGTQNLRNLTGVPVGTNVGSERINADRVDTDLTLSYFLPDVVKDVMDVSLGGGVKWIRVSGHRTVLPGHVPQLIQFVYQDASTGFQTTTRSFIDNFYAATFPISLNFHLTQDKKWFLPVTLTPLIGYEESKDEAFRTRPRLSGSSGFKDSLAKGATLDAGVRYVFDNGVAVYAGYRAQVISAVDLYVAHGPLVNVSIRFGDK